MPRVFYPDAVENDEYERHKLLQELNRRSRESGPLHAVVVDGQIKKSAIGSIHLAHYRHRAEPETLVLKSIDLNEQNMFAVTKNNKRTTLRGLSESHVMITSTSKSECQDWASIFALHDDALVCKIAFLRKNVKEDGSTAAFLCNEYLNEAFVGLILTRNSRLPHFIQTYDAWIRDATGFILQEYGGKTLCERLPDLSFEQFKSIVVQTLVFMAITQRYIHFKHHDLHLENVFVKQMESTSRLLVKPVWTYCLSKMRVKIEHHGVLAKIGDYGLSSITEPVSKTRIQRVDFPQLDAGDPEWGQWSSRLDNQYSYDALVLLSKFFLEEEKSIATARQSEWARGAFNAIREKWPEVTCSLIGRPLRGHEGTATIEDILSLPFFNEFHCTDDNIDAIAMPV